MIQKLKQTIFIAVASLLLATPAVAVGFSSSAYAANDIASQICTGSNAGGQVDANQGVSCTDGGDGLGNSVNNIAKKVINIFSLIVGAVAVIMIIYGGFRYITSGGESNRVGSAKNTLIYALVGLIIVALAQVIVHFVLAQTQSTI
jgi:hypothetical protein